MIHQLPFHVGNCGYKEIQLWILLNLSLLYPLFSNTREREKIKIRSIYPDKLLLISFSLSTTSMGKVLPAWLETCFHDTWHSYVMHASRRPWPSPFLWKAYKDWGFLKNVGFPTICWPTVAVHKQIILEFIDSIKDKTTKQILFLPISIHNIGLNFWSHSFEKCGFNIHLLPFQSKAFS